MDRMLLDFGQWSSTDAVPAGPGLAASIVTVEQQVLLRMEAVAGDGPHSVALRAPEGHWDVSDHLYVAVELCNSGLRETMVSLEVHSEGAEAWANRNDVSTVLRAGERKTVKVLIVRLPLEEQSALGRYFAGAAGATGGEYGSGMLGLPGGFTWHWNRIDPARVTAVVVALPFARGGEVIEITRVTAEGKYDPPGEEELRSGFTPFVDEFGQYRHREWPGKVHAAGDLARAREQEDADLAAHLGPPEWNRYGGCVGGPQLEATGFFYPTKHQGKWWLVDPEGRLFWSHGVDCVGLDWAATRIAGREHYFQGLPAADSPLSQYYRRRDDERYWYSFSQANLWRKYGSDWRLFYADRIHARLRSWGMNTVANWSIPEVCLLRKTPYVVDIHYRARNIEGNEKLPDPFDPGFREALRASLAARPESVGDPWCIGYFVDNELNWQEDVEAGVLVATAPPDQAAKEALVKGLAAKYGAIGALNSAWGTRHGSWQELLACRQAPELARAYDDLAAFFQRLTETYFQACRDAVKALSPSALYLGCRLHRINPRVAAIAARYCDVLSINCYRYHVRAMPLPEGLDVPVVIGEWHFGALDRGPLHPGLRHVQDQSERAVMYASYLRGALSQPAFVGAHWFQYGDQATTGRDDGENCQVGFIDVCDTPYWKTIAACREVGYGLYQYRLRGEQ